jgi:hypothetical protein
MSKPSAVILRELKKLAAYHCQVQIYTTCNKVTNKLKFGFIKELFYGDPGKNIKGACEQVIDGNGAFSRLYQKLEGEDGIELTLKSLCCGVNTSAIMWPVSISPHRISTRMQQVSTFLADPFG